MNGYLDAVRESKNYNNYKLTADKVIQTLSDVRNERTKSRRRWIWELMQNAKDVPNIFGGVTVEIILRENEFVFSHNGNPFSVENITGLIQQVSSGKPSDSTNKRITGKFGTGFISTHLLSDIVKVKGIVEREGLTPKYFEFELNRKAEKSEELIDFISAELDKIEEIEDDNLFPRVPNYHYQRKENDFDSVFVYPLESTESREAAKIGVADLETTLPQTLFFVDELKKVIIKDEIENKTTIYELCSNNNCFDNYSLPHIRVATNGDTIDYYFVRYRDEVLDLAVRVKNHSEKEIDYIPKSPRLFRDFPLVGTESFIFPFILNGFNFFPTDKRDNILLTAIESSKVKTNRDIFNHAIEKSKEFVVWLIKNNAKNFSYVAQSRIPNCLLENEIEVKNWYKNSIQKSYRQFIINQEIVETSGTKMKIGDAVIPKFSGTKEENETFWEIVKDYFGSGKVCKKEHLHLWQENLGPESEIETWGQKVFYSIKDLITEIQSKQTLENIVVNDDNSSNIQWLNKVYQFLIDNKLTDDYCKTYKIIPTIKGTLKSFSDLLFIEKETKIPDEFISIFKAMKNEDWNDILIHRGLITINSSHSSKRVKDISDEINTILNQTMYEYGRCNETFYKQVNAETILLQILRISSSQSEDTFQAKLFNSAKQFFNSEFQPIVLQNISDFNFSPAKKQLIKLLNMKIENAKILSDLNVVNSGQWLLAHLLLLQDNAEFKQQLEFGNIVPNRKEELIAYEDIFAYGTEDNPLDGKLIDILFDLNNSEDWNKFLIHDDFHKISRPPKKIDELANKIQGELEKLRVDNAYSSKSTSILNLIHWCSNHSIDAQKYFGSFMAQKDKIFVNISLEDNKVGDNVVKLLQNKEILSDLVEIAEMSATVGIDKIKEFARHIKDEQEDFEFKKQIGESIETVFIEAFKSLKLPYIIEYQGRGDKDVIIRNSSNGKEFYIELKSLSPSNCNKDLRLSISQAKKAVEQINGENYVVSVLVRPANWKTATVEFIKENLTSQFNIGRILGAVIEKNKTFEQLQNTADEIYLEFESTTRKIIVPEYIWRREGYSFDVLIEKIKKYLESLLYDYPNYNVDI